MFFARLILFLIFSITFCANSSSSSSSSLYQHASFYPATSSIVNTKHYHQDGDVDDDSSLLRLSSSNNYGAIHQDWDVNDWWQENLREDLYDLYKSPRSIIEEAPMNEFYEKINLDHHHHNHNDNHDHHEQASSMSSKRHETHDLETSESERISDIIPVKFTLSSSVQHKHKKKSLENHKIIINNNETKLDNFTEEKRIQQLNFFNQNNSNNEKLKQQPPQQQQVESFYMPTSSLSSIKSMFYEYFTQIRSNLYDDSNFIMLKRNLRSKFLDIGLKTAIQSFYHPKRKDKGHNIVGIYPGLYRNTSKDSILVIGAHYDTVPRSPGVEDNGSGSVAVMELARLLNRHHCKLNTTIIFVLFDMEEDGLIGSKHFVKNYLIPVEKDKNQVQIKGAIIMDMLLEYDPSVGSQSTAGIGSILPEWNRRVQRNRYRGDFTAVWARRDVDSQLYQTLSSSWLNRHKYKLLLMDPPLPKLGRDLNKRKLAPYKTFLRSDHSSFWYPNLFKNQTINAILLTDLGPWRWRVADKYHSPLDNSKLLNRENLLFLKNNIDSMMETILIIGNGTCKQ